MNKSTFSILRFLSGSAIAIIAFYGVSNFCALKTDRFSVARVHSDLKFDARWVTTDMSAQEKANLLSAIQQNFYYLGCGGQCFAFVSEDGKYVLKFFKHKIRKPLNFILKMSLPKVLAKKRDKKMQKILFKLNRDFNSYKIAYETLPAETGLLFIHLNKTDDLHTAVTIHDKLGIAHSISLDCTEFILQKKAELAYEHIEKLIKTNDQTALKEAFHSILEVIVSRCKKGIYDEDARIHRNFGFIDNKALLIDVGRFRRDPERVKPSVYTKDLEQITERFRKWLNETHPSVVSILDEEIYAYKNQI